MGNHSVMSQQSLDTNSNAPAISSLQNQIAWLTANREKIARYAFIAQIIAAVPFLAFAYYTGHVHARLLLKGNRAQGKIVEMKAVPFQYRSNSGSTSTKTIYEPVIDFVAGGRLVRFQEWKGADSSAGRGRSVPVLYDPADISVAMMDRGPVNWLPWAPCFAIGLLLAVVATRGFLTLLFRRDAATNLSAPY